MNDQATGPARVVIDGRIVGPAPNGISRYVTLLARGLASIRDASDTGLPYEPVFLTRRERWPGSEDAFSGFATWGVSAPFLSPREIVEIPVAIRAIRMMGGVRARTIYHSPSFSSLVSCPVPWLVTVHDLIHLHYGSPATRLYYRVLLRPFLRGATERMTVSEVSRREISRWAGVPQETLRVISNAIHPSLICVPSEEDSLRTLARLGLVKNRYFLCLSSAKPHKNVPLLLDAYRLYREQLANSATEALPLFLNIPGVDHLPGVRRCGVLPDPELNTLMASAAAFFFPSRMEGFGLPPLEAGVMGAPLAVSKIPPIEEALETFTPGEVCWVEPTDINAWAQAFARAAAGELPRPGVESRRRALARFTVCRLGEDADRTYRRVLGV